MSKFYVDKNNIFKDKLLICRDEARHIMKVLRYKENDLITLFDSEGTTYECVIKSYENEEISAEILEKIENKNSGKTEIVLVQAVLKSKKMDFVIPRNQFTLGINYQAGVQEFFTIRGRGNHSGCDKRFILFSQLRDKN